MVNEDLIFYSSREARIPADTITYRRTGEMMLLPGEDAKSHRRLYFPKNGIKCTGGESGLSRQFIYWRSRKHDIYTIHLRPDTIPAPRSPSDENLVQFPQ